MTPSRRSILAFFGFSSPWRGRFPPSDPGIANGRVLGLSISSSIDPFSTLRVARCAPMPDQNDENDNLLPFRRPTKPAKNARERQTRFGAEPEDIVAAAGVIVALVVAVAIASAWVPFSIYTLGIVACSGVAAAIAKLIKARRSKASPAKPTFFRK